MTAVVYKISLSGWSKCATKTMMRFDVKRTAERRSLECILVLDLFIV